MQLVTHWLVAMHHRLKTVQEEHCKIKHVSGVGGEGVWEVGEGQGGWRGRGAASNFMACLSFSYLTIDADVFLARA